MSVIAPGKSYEFILGGKIRTITIPKVIDPWACFFWFMGISFFSMIIGGAGIAMYSDPEMGWIGTTAAVFISTLVVIAMFVSSTGTTAKEVAIAWLIGTSALYALGFYGILLFNIISWIH